MNKIAFGRPSWMKVAGAVAGVGVILLLSFSFRLIGTALFGFAAVCVLFSHGTSGSTCVIAAAAPLLAAAIWGWAVGQCYDNKQWTLAIVTALTPLIIAFQIWIIRWLIDSGIL